MGLRNNKSYKTTKRMKRRRNFTTVAEDKVENKRRQKMSRHVGWIVWGGGKRERGKKCANTSYGAMQCLGWG